MASVTLRSVKGTPLTHVEMDANFTNINNELVNTVAFNTATNEVEITDVGGTTKTANLNSLVDEAVALSIALG